ncbi:hypothetical protein AEAC466_09175 [Asticcacaulis sp. AC466]|uniref:hypothetical protein n=1 Tax=Asticcacaulis sp. AC466 TaxID=1282362 RepID=UPI0003C3EBFE|nr:hypothetical protein [Asticcacaulis sp. AC466]ESQ84513.1 hypothetical protein AEAC466_09175 [Asticcacaulis sp. AC466]
MNLTFDFAFEGFRLIRQRPKLIALWGAITLFGHGVISLILVQMAGPAITRFGQLMTDASATGTFDPVAIEAQLQIIMPAMIMCVPVYILMSSVLACAICRASLGETDDRLGFLSFGLPEIRMIALRSVMALGLIGVLLTGGLLGQIVAVSGNAQVAQGMTTLGFLVAGGIAVWLGIRLSLNGPQTFDTGRFNLFGSFNLTRERFWSLFTGYATAGALALVVQFLCDKVIEAIQVLSLGLKVTGDIVPPDMSNMSAFLVPHSIILLFLTFGIVTPLMAAITLGAPVAAYRVLREKGETLKTEQKVS